MPSAPTTPPSPRVNKEEADQKPTEQCEITQDRVLEAVKAATLQGVEAAVKTSGVDSTDKAKEAVSAIDWAAVMSEAMASLKEQLAGVNDDLDAAEPRRKNANATQ